MKNIKNILLIIFVCLLFINNKYISAGDGLFQANAVIQISTIVSDGKYSIREIVDIAKKNNVKVVMLTDRDFMNWEYGLPLLRNIVKKKVEANSISKYGIKRYFEEIEKIQKENPDLILIAGVESAPFYYWEGRPFKNDFKIVDWHKHILVFGLDKPEDYGNLPSVSNKNSLVLPYSFKDIYRFWPLPVLITGILCLKKRKFKYKDSQGNHLGSYSRPWQVFGGLCLIIGIIFSINGYPFRGIRYDQYHGYREIGPYQELINYANKKGGMAFWAHPEIDNISQYDKVKIETKEYPEYVLESRNYTGFTIFYEGDEKIGSIGGMWDKVLKEYCGKLRAAPVWAIGGLGFDQTGDLGEAVKDLQTIFLVPDINKEAVMNALRNGKMYVVRGKDCGNFILDSFTVSDSLSSISGTIADELTLEGRPVFNIAGHLADGKNTDKLKVKLIRNGFVIETFEVGSPFKINYRDDHFFDFKKGYYRLEITAPGRVLVTNPIFIITTV